MRCRTYYAWDYDKTRRKFIKESIKQKISDTNDAIED